MQKNVYINELRVPLEEIRYLQIFQYQSSGLSTGHKKHLERRLGQDLSCIAIFEGDVLFCLPTQGDIAKAEDEITQLLDEEINSFTSTALMIINLGTIPETSIKRLVFATISFYGAGRGNFRLFGRTLFRPSKDDSKVAHVELETAMVTEDDFIKIHFIPSFIALEKLSDTQREDRTDLQLIGLCQYRSQCPLARWDGSCPYILPGQLGYFSQEIRISDIKEEDREAFTEAYTGCPQFPNAEMAVLVKASKKATNYLIHPSYVIHVRFSSEDLQHNPQLASKYRAETLMSSSDRWEWSSKWLKLLLGVEPDDIESGELELPINDLMFPLDVIFSHPFLLPPAQAQEQPIYTPVVIPEQRIVNDQQTGRSQFAGGGYLFSRDGAYDREDNQRPFHQVQPYVIMPGNNNTILNLTRKLLSIFSDGQYKARNSYDQAFLGLNLPESQKKYHCNFVNVWDDEENVFLVDGTLEGYLEAAEAIKLDWLSREPDPNRIALVVIPDRPLNGEENAFYYQTKTVLLEAGIPSQHINFSKLLDLDKPHKAFGPVLQSLWLNIYSKMGGKPWRLSNELGNVHCFIGIGFGLSTLRTGNHIYAGVAHVFDRFGSWIDVASSWESISEEDHESFISPLRYLEGTSSFKISQEVTYRIVREALHLYQRKQTATHESAKNIVLHKLGPIYECEIEGFLKAVTQTVGTLSECQLGILQVEQDHAVRLYGDPENNNKTDRTVLRRAGLIFNENKMVVATTGSIQRGRGPMLYPGIGTPQPLLLTRHLPSEPQSSKYGCAEIHFYNIQTLGEHLVALTQLHWGSTRDNIRLPITALYAQKVADIISKTGARVDARSSFHIPWFL